VKLAGTAGQAACDGVAAADPGDGAGAGVDAGGDPCELAPWVDNRLHPPSASAGPATAPSAAQTVAAAAHLWNFAAAYRAMGSRGTP
jgi:hypothetical protein